MLWFTIVAQYSCDFESCLRVLVEKQIILCKRRIRKCTMCVCMSVKIVLSKIHDWCIIHTMSKTKGPLKDTKLLYMSTSLLFVFITLEYQINLKVAYGSNSRLGKPRRDPHQLFLTSLLGS